MQPTSSRTSGLAIASLLISLFFCACGLQGFVAIPLALLAAVRIRRSSNRLAGMDIAAAAFVVGVLGVALSIGIGGVGAFGIAREREVRPIAERLVRDMSEGELERARHHFVPSMRDAPRMMPMLAQLSEILRPLGELERLESSGFQLSPGSFRAEYDGVFARGRASIEVGFTDEGGEWLVDAFFVRRRSHHAPTPAPTERPASAAEEHGAGRPAPVTPTGAALYRPTWPTTTDTTTRIRASALGSARSEWTRRSVPAAWAWSTAPSTRGSSATSL